MKLPFSSSALATCLGLAATSASFRPAHAEPVVAMVLNAEGAEPGEGDRHSMATEFLAKMKEDLWQVVPQFVAKYTTIDGEEMSTPVIPRSALMVKMPMAAEAGMKFVLVLYGQALVAEVPQGGLEKDAWFALPIGDNFDQSGVGFHTDPVPSPYLVGLFCNGHSDEISFIPKVIPEGAIIREESIIGPARLLMVLCMEEGDSMTMTAEANHVAMEAFVLGGSVAAQTEVTIMDKKWAMKVVLGEGGEKGDIAVYQADANVLPLTSQGLRVLNSHGLRVLLWPLFSLPGNGNTYARDPLVML